MTESMLPVFDAGDRPYVLTQWGDDEFTERKVREYRTALAEHGECHIPYEDWKQLVDLTTRVGYNVRFRKSQFQDYYPAWKWCYGIGLDCVAFIPIFEEDRVKHGIVLQFRVEGQCIET